MISQKILLFTWNIILVVFFIYIKFPAVMNLKTPPYIFLTDLSDRLQGHGVAELMVEGADSWLNHSEIHKSFLLLCCNISSDNFCRAHLQDFHFESFKILHICLFENETQSPKPSAYTLLQTHL